MLARFLFSSLASLSLNLKGCDNITDEGLMALMYYLPSGLDTFSLNVDSRESLTDECLKALACTLPSRLLADVQVFH